MNAAQKYGARHGTQFCINPEHDVDTWLDFMQGRLGSRYQDYEDGFMDGMLGKHKLRYRKYVIMPAAD